MANPLLSPSSAPLSSPFLHRPAETRDFAEHPSQASSGTYVAGLASWGTAHVQDAFVLLWSQSHDREETGGSLQHVVPSQVLRGGTWTGKAERKMTRERKGAKSGSAQPYDRKSDLTHGHGGVINNKSRFRPLPQGVEIHATVDQSLQDKETGLRHRPVGQAVQKTTAGPCSLLTCARSRRRVLSVLVRMVTGRGTSLASRKFISWMKEGTENRGEKKRIEIKMKTREADKSSPVSKDMDRTGSYLREREDVHELREQEVTVGIVGSHVPAQQCEVLLS